ncbi:hypothetical protein BKA70DRAFT_1400297 [Coprinopsis sp. MPI-PUGE-AT-0042]|nr:hypothetical protein BKA70DRAFT_1400297 [Coprinopsis sp. MPI-PUGE-AT-0042]
MDDSDNVKHILYSFAHLQSSSRRRITRSFSRKLTQQSSGSSGAMQGSESQNLETSLPGLTEESESSPTHCESEEEVEKALLDFSNDDSLAPLFEAQAQKMREDLENFDATLRVYEEARREHGPNKDILTIALSSMNATHLDRLNVTKISIKSLEEFTSLVDGLFESNLESDKAKGYEEFMKTSLPSLAEQLSLVKERVAYAVALGVTEPRSRMLMDPFLLRLSAIAKLSKANESAFLFPELILAINNKKTTPVAFDISGKLTILSGLTDYAVLLLDCDSLLPDYTVDDVLKAATLKELGKIFKGRDALKGSIVLEAKRGEHKLLDHLPQMIGEAILFINGLQLLSVNWALSNGKEWVFGVLQRRGSIDEGFVTYYNEKPVTFDFKLDGAAPSKTVH